MPKAVSMARTFESIGYEPHSGQRLVHSNKGATGRFRIVCAGRRTGKSTMGGHELVPHAMEAYYKQSDLDRNAKRMEYWIVGPEYSDGEKEFRVLWNDLTKLEFPMDKPGSYNDVLGGNMHISLWQGKFQVHVKSAKYPDNLVGEALHGVILAEAAKLKPKIWTKYLRPMLSDYRGWALMTSTPEGKNWFYELWQAGQRGDSEHWSIRMPSWTNDILFPLGRQDPEIRSLGAGLTEEMFAQEIAADFTEYTGRVFKNFDEEIHVRHLQFNPAWETFAAVDYGWTNPTVWLLIQIDPWDNVYVLDEYYERGRQIDEIADDIEERGLVPKQLRTFYPDPASPEDSAYLSNRFRINSAGGTGGEIRDRLNLIRKWLKVPDHLQHLAEDHPERQPKLLIDHKCRNMVREMQDYRYPENKSEIQNDKEQPMKKDDHTPEALGRFFISYFGPREQAGRAKVRQSSMSREPVSSRSGRIKARG